MSCRDHLTPLRSRHCHFAALVRDSSEHTNDSCAAAEQHRCLHRAYRGQLQVDVAVEKPFLAMAVFTTLHGENSLNRHGRGDILGVLRSSFATLRISPAGSDARKAAQLRLVLTPRSRGEDSLRMTTGKSV